MKFFTLLLFGFLSLFSTALLAKPEHSTFSVPADTLLLMPATEVADSSASLNPSLENTDENMPESVAPTILAVGDFCGQGTGFIDITPDPNTPGPWTYQWSTGATTQDINGLSAGTYTVFITDANGNSQAAQIDVPDLPPAAPTGVNAVPTGNTVCMGNFNGALDITVLPIAVPWTYLWSTGATTQDVTGLNSGVYTVSITFGVTCTSTFQFTVPDLAGAPIITLPPPANGVVPSTCERADGIAGVIVTGGVQPYTYSWSNGGTNTAIQNVLAGTYTITVTGANGCTDTQELTVTNINWPIVIEMANVTLVPNTTCFGGNGSIDVPVVHPIIQGPFSYQWSNGATTQTISNLTPGTYWLTVSLNAACFDVEGWYVEDEPVLPTLTYNNTPTTCGLSNGFVNLTILPGGVPAYTYLWSTGATTQDLANVPAGIYDVTITSGNGCTVTSDATVDDTQIQFGYNALVTDQSSCDTSNGQINLSLFPANLAFQWSNGATTKTLKNLAPGDYTVTISAGGTCTAVETYSVGDVTEYPSIPAAPTASSCGLANGSIDLTVAGNATAPFTFQWSNGATTEDLSGILADTFYVTVTSAVGCSKENIVIVPNVNDTLTILANVADNLSCTLPTGNIALNVTPLDTAYTFLWSSGQTVDSLSNLAPGTYLVTVTLGVSCIALDTFEVLNNALPPNLATTGVSANCDLNIGSVDLSVSSGTGPFTYLWSNTATTEDLSGLTPGTYSVTVSGANNCTAVSSATVLSNNVPLNVNGLPAGNTLCAAANGSIDIGITPAGTYNYLWSNAATTEDISNLGSGTYTVTVSLGTCLSTGTFTVADNALSPNLSSSAVPANCGLSDGAADLSVNGTFAPYSFLWSNAATTEDLSSLTPGSYSVTVTGANNCTAVNSVNVLNNNIALNVSSSPAGNTSCLNANGAIDISVNPAGTYTYLWSNAATTEDLSGLLDGAYTVTVTLGTCLSTTTFAVADNTATPVLASGITPAICSLNNGAIDLSVSGTAGPFTYLWSNAATTEDLSAIPPGNYSVTVTAPNGCTEVTNLNVANNASNFSLAATPAPLTNCAANNGAIDLNVTPAGAFTYLWSNAATTEDLSGLPPGTYTVSVTQSGSCTATASYFVLDQRTNPISSQAIVAELCGLSDGSIDLSVNGGTLPYGYLWNPGQVSQDLSNLSAGTYTVTVTDANNCTVTSMAVVPGNSIAFSLAGTPSDNSSCLQNNGAVDLSVNPVGAFTYLWSNLATTQDLSGLNAGIYTVTVSAGGNCTNTAVFNLVNNVPSPLVAQSVSAAFCGQASGGIDLSISGSPAPYQFIWSNLATTEDLSNILSGAFTVTVTAANGCTTVDNFTVPENVFTPAIASQLSASTSCVVSNGAIDLTITPAQAYTFLWSNAATTEDLSNLSAGAYTVTVSGGGACTNTAVLTVGSTIPLPVLSDNIAAATCGQASGSIDVSVSGSPAPYDYLWSNAATTEDLANVLSGSFTITVTAANGCTSVESYTVPENTITPLINGTPTASSSCVLNNGSIDLTVGPATGYTFIWSNAATTEDLAGIAPGTYTVTVNGGGACTNTASFSVGSTVPSPALSDNIAAATCGQASGSIDVSVSGSPAPYGYLWSNAATSEDLTNLLSGTFTITVTAANGCTSTGSYTVPENTIIPLLNGIPTPASSCVALVGAIDLTVGPASGYTFSWSNAATTEDLSGLAAGSYTVTVNGGGACIATASFSIADQTTQPQAAINAATTALDCSTTSTTLNGSVTGTPNPSSFQWSQNGTPLGTGSNLPVNAPGQYDLVVQDNVTFCTASASITVTQNLNPPGLAIASPALLTCNAPGQTLTGSSTVGGVQFSWATIVGTDTTLLGSGPSLSVSAAGTYVLLGVNPANNCANAVSVSVVADQAPPTASAGTPFTLDCAGETAPLSGSGSGANNLSYLWTTQDGHFVSGAGTAIPLIDEAGTYQLLVTNTGNGCTDTDLVTIEPEIPVAFVSIVQPTCLDQQGIVQIDSVTGLSEPILYSLNNGTPATQNQFTNLEPGNYTVQVLGNNGCNATVNAVVDPPALVELTLAPEASIILGYTYQIDAQLNIPNANIASISWTPGTGLVCDTCLSTEATPYSTTDYQLLVVSDKGCEARGNLHLIVDKTRHIYAPNIFSPNEDGRNDLFSIYGDPVNVVRIKSLQVFSRWGEAVYERRDFAPSDTQIGWDGTLNGQKMDPAVFVWQAVVLYIDGKEEFFKGDVTLVR